MKGFNFDNQIRRNKVYTVILALILSLLITRMTRFHCGSMNDDAVWGLSDVNYINKFSISAIVLAVLLFGIFLYIIHLSEQYI